MPQSSQDILFMEEALRLSKAAAQHGNEPFGAVLVKDGAIVYSNENQVHSASDPTFHAEAGLLRRFCAETGITDLREYTLYSSCEPCFMCSGARCGLGWAGWYTAPATGICAPFSARRARTALTWSFPTPTISLR